MKSKTIIVTLVKNVIVNKIIVSDYEKRILIFDI